jgi:hypothetical protein
VEVSIALPGNAGEDADWLHVLNRSGINAVCESILTAERYEPTKAEIAAERRRAKQTSAGASARQQSKGNGGREVIQLQEERRAPYRSAAVAIFTSDCRRGLPRNPAFGLNFMDVALELCDSLGP